MATTIAALDEKLGGGIPARSITEVVGPPGAGKTQLCHMLALLATLPVALGGLDGNVLYFDTEASARVPVVCGCGPRADNAGDRTRQGAFSADRLVEMARSRLPDYFAAQPQRIDRVASSVMVYHVKSTGELMEQLKALENLIITHNVKLVIVDSVASVVRREYDNKQIKDRQALLIEQAQTLKQAAERFDIPVLVTNQVTGRVGANDGLNGQGNSGAGSGGGSSNVTAALGAVWAHAVNTRLVLENRGASGGRHLFVAKSPRCAVCSLQFAISAAGPACISDGPMVDCEGNYFGFGLIAHQLDGAD